LLWPLLQLAEILGYFPLLLEACGLVLQGQRWHQGSGYFGRTWQPGDVVGCMINLDDASMVFTLNGELLITNKGSELAFADYEIENGNPSLYPPLLTLCCWKKTRMNWQSSVSLYWEYIILCIFETLKEMATSYAAISEESRQIIVIVSMCS
jgi:ryanodine receptor 3